MKAHEINSFNNFICGWYTEDSKLCEDIIDYHKNSSNKYPGLTGGGYQPVFKKSTDVIFRPDTPTLFNRYITHLVKVFSCYAENYPHVSKAGEWGFSENINIQHYAPGEGFYAWHTERFTSIEPIVSRHMVFMTYLNNVYDEGQTEFFHQKIAIKPERGLTLIWPVDWTFTHRGIPSKTEHKFITTGWINLMKNNISTNANSELTQS